MSINLPERISIEDKGTGEGKTYRLCMLRVRTKDADGKPSLCDIVRDMDNKITLHEDADLNWFITAYLPISIVGDK